MKSIGRLISLDNLEAEEPEHLSICNHISNSGI